MFTTKISKEPAKASLSPNLSLISFVNNINKYNSKYAEVATQAGIIFNAKFPTMKLSPKIFGLYLKNKNGYTP